MAAVMPGAEATRSRTGWGWLVRLVVCVAALGVALLAAVWLSVQFGETASREPDILWLRAQHAVLAAIMGAALGASGCALQGLLQNPLADPFVLGVSGGAALGASAALALGLGTLGHFLPAGLGADALNLSAPAAFAFVGALGATALVFAVGSARGRASPYSALLTGVVFNAFAAAAVSCIKVLAPPERIGSVLRWLAGNLGYESSGTLAAAGALQLIAVGGLWYQSARLNLLALGDEDATSLGVNVGRTRVAVLLLSSLSVAGAVALSGLIGFVGLIVPHILRLVLGPDQRVLIPASAVGGACFLVLADVGARLLFRTFNEVPPVGVVTALLGGPFFLFLLRRREAAL
jgi:iron complex transport system permease protein